jgi:hypothetical protein
MTGFLNHQTHDGTLMPTNSKNVIRLPNGDIQIDPHGRKYDNDAWYKEVQKSGTINYEWYCPKLSKDASTLIVKFLFDIYLCKICVKSV